MVPKNYLPVYLWDSSDSSDSNDSSDSSDNSDCSDSSDSSNSSENSNCDETQKLKLWQNSKTQTVTKCDITQKLQIVTKLKNSNYDKTQKLKLWQNSKNQIVTYFSKNNQLDTSTSVWCVQGSFSQTCDVYWRGIETSKGWFSKKNICPTIGNAHTPKQLKLRSWNFCRLFSQSGQRTKKGFLALTV